MNEDGTPNEWTILHKLKIAAPKNAILAVISENLMPTRRYRILCDSVIISEFGGVHEKEDIFVESTGEMQIFDLLTNGSEDRGEGDRFSIFSYRS